MRFFPSIWRQKTKRACASPPALLDDRQPRPVSLAELIAVCETLETLARRTFTSGDMTSTLDNSALSRQLLRPESGDSEGEEYGSGYDDEQCTQPVDPRPLTGLMVYVDVRSGTGSSQNHSGATAQQLETLGATVCRRFTKDVTHVVFKDGRPTTREKAEKKGLYLVSPLWVEACKRANDRVSEVKYPMLCWEGSDSPLVLGKLKRIKSLQPKPLEEEIARSLERSKKRKRADDVGSAKKKQFVLASHTNNKPDSSDSEVEFSGNSPQDSFELPAITLPGTPVVPGAAAHSPVVTPVSVSQKTVPRDKPSSQRGRKTLPPISEQESETPVKDSASKGRKVVAAATKSKPPKPVLLKSSNKVAMKAVKPASERRRRKENEDTPQPMKTEEGDGCARRRRRGRFKGSAFEKQKPTLVLTSVQPKDQEIVFSIIERLGGFDTSKTVCESTTHIICGSPRRTVNVLAATAKGCWVLSLDWVWKSLEAGRWAREEPYEMTDHFPAAQFFRLERQQAGLLYRPSLFTPAGPIFIASTTTPPPVQLELLLSLAGAKISGSHRKADVCIGCKSWSEEVKSVSEHWVLDSISEHQFLPLEDYLLDDPRSRANSPEL